MTFLEKLDAAVAKNNSLLCVGLDPDLAKLRPGVDQFTFNRAIIDATADLVCCYKPNSAFYEADGAAGIERLKQTCDYVKQTYPELPILLDFKRGDIGNTNRGYASFAFGYLSADAVTVQPYQGQEAVQPFLDYADKGIFVLCRTSNTGAGEFQDLLTDGRPLYEYVTHQVVTSWNTNHNAFVVAGATFPAELAVIRKLAGEAPILVPGIGAQQGDVAAMLKAGLNTAGRGLIVNSSRETIFASSGTDFATAARAKATELRDRINSFRDRG